MQVQIEYIYAAGGMGSLPVHWQKTSGTLMSEELSVVLDYNLFEEVH